MRYIFDAPDLVAPFVAARINHGEPEVFDQGRIVTMGVHDGKQLIAGLVYHNWNKTAGIIEISGAAIDPRWLTRQTLALMHYYPFVDCRCQQVIMRVRADNERLLRQLAVVGYAFIRFPRLYGRTRDGVIALLTDDAWGENPIFRRANRGLPLPQYEEAA